MNIISKILVIIILALDIYLFNSLRKNEITVCGKNPLSAISQTIVAFFVVIVLVSKSFTTTNILLMFVAAMYLLFGNGSGICNKGIVSNSMLIPWNKISRFSIQDEKDKKILIFYVNDIEKKIIFKKEDENNLMEALMPIAHKTKQNIRKK